MLHVNPQLSFLLPLVLHSTVAFFFVVLAHVVKYTAVSQDASRAMVQKMQESGCSMSSMAYACITWTDNLHDLMFLGLDEVCAPMSLAYT